MKTLEQRIEAYNKKAKKWGYPELLFENGKLIGEFIPQHKQKGDSIWTEFKIAGRNGYLEEDYKKIYSNYIVNLL